jgi:uncharacterized protein YbjT (DUF2867 family)
MSYVIHGATGAQGAPLLAVLSRMGKDVTAAVRDTATATTKKSEGILRYPIRADYRVSWSSHLDVAEVAARLLTDTSTTGIVGVGHLPPLVGAELAEGLSQYLGRKVEFEGIAPEAFGAMIAPLFGEGAAAGVVAGYQAQAALSANAIDSNTSAQNRLGLASRSVQQWLAEVGA